MKVNTLLITIPLISDPSHVNGEIHICVIYFYCTFELKPEVNRFLKYLFTLKITYLHLPIIY